MKKTVVLGWDGVPPRIVFEDLLDNMPNLKKLLGASYYGSLESTKPPITVPAWMTMMTGCDPGQLGIYGFRHRTPGNYKDIWIPDSSKISAKKLWDFVGESNGRVIVLGVPPTYPPPKVNGILVSGFIAPDTSHNYTYPASFADTITELIGEYDLDVFYRTNDKEQLITDLFEMTRKRHRLAKHLIEHEDWDLFILMEIGPDRLHHGFWRYYDESHDRYEEHAEYNAAFVEYYKLIDKHLGEILDLVPDDCLFALVSDHGAKGRKGAFCINQWLREKGLLSLGKETEVIQSFEDLDIDWKRTRAWAWGGYYSRIFINCEGYEQEGIVTHEEYEAFRNELAEILLKIRGPNGEVWQNIVDKPEDVYEECNGDYPDLMVYFDDLRWRVSGSMGHESLYYYENGAGPDDAIHDWFGIFVIRYPGQTRGGRIERNILDIAPTLLNHMGLKVPDYMKGAPIRSN